MHLLTSSPALPPVRHPGQLAPVARRPGQPHQSTIRLGHQLWIVFWTIVVNLSAQFGTGQHCRRYFTRQVSTVCQLQQFSALFITKQIAPLLSHCFQLARMAATIALITIQPSGVTTARIHHCQRLQIPHCNCKFPLHIIINIIRPFAIIFFFFSCIKPGCYRYHHSPSCFHFTNHRHPLPIASHHHSTRRSRFLRTAPAHIQAPPLL